jgi:CRISPR system Cascade subunit CasB
MTQNKLTFVNNSELHDALVDWWNSLDETRGDRAALRRCRNTVEVAFVPSFHRLRWNLYNLGWNYVNTESLAVIAGVLSHVKSNDESDHIAAQMGKPKKEGSSAPVHGLRFRRFLKVEEREDLLKQMVRIVRLLDGNVNIPSLADSIYWWNDYTRKEWAYKYYDKAPNEV